MSSGLYQVHVNPDTARTLVENGATLVFLDVPAGTVLGIDHHKFITGHNFKGAKMVPPGVHVISYAAARPGSGFDLGPTTAFFVDLRATEVTMWRWMASEEILCRLDDEEEVSAIERATKRFELDRYLAPYNLSGFPVWRKLSCHLSRSVIDDVAPVGGNISLLAEPTPKPVADDTEQPGADKVEASNQLASQESTAAAHAGRCFFTKLPRLVKQKGRTPAELTSLNLDKSPVLEELLKNKYKDDEDKLLGEFQFAFLAFLLGHSWEAFEQWKAFIFLLFDCEVSAAHRAGLFAGFLNALNSQLELTLTSSSSKTQNDSPTDAGGMDLGFALDIEDLLADSKIRKVCSGWLRWALNESAGALPDSVLAQARQLSIYLETRLGWSCGPIKELRPDSSRGRTSLKIGRSPSQLSGGSHVIEVAERHPLSVIDKRGQDSDAILLSFEGEGEYMEEDDEEEGPVYVELTESQKEYLRQQEGA